MLGNLNLSPLMRQLTYNFGPLLFNSSSVLLPGIYTECLASFFDDGPADWKEVKPSRASWCRATLQVSNIHISRVLHVRGTGFIVFEFFSHCFCYSVPKFILIGSIILVVETRGIHGCS